MLHYFFFILLSLCFASCGHAPFRGNDVVGADEFVMDSYRIKEGKLSVLELSGQVIDALDETHLEEYPEVVNNGDVLNISIIQPSSKELVESVRNLSNSSSLVVREGKIALPDLEPIDIKGLTLSQATAIIQKAYDKIYRGTQVFMCFKDKNESKIYFSGLVGASTLNADGKLRLFEALSLAKTPTNANLFRSYVIRDGQMLSVDLQRLMKEGDMSQNIVMKGGDKIYIADAAASSVMVMGEVGHPAVIPVIEGSITIKTALAEAGGIPFTGDKSYIQVIRGSLQNPKIYTLNFKHIMRLPSDSLLLIPGDVVYVATTPLGEWNNFVVQILPTLIGADLITRGGKNIGIDISR